MSLVLDEVSAFSLSFFLLPLLERSNIQSIRVTAPMNINTSNITPIHPAILQRLPIGFIPVFTQRVQLNCPNATENMLGGIGDGADSGSGTDWISGHGNCPWTSNVDVVLLSREGSKNLMDVYFLGLAW
ncbi:hypothetical protein PDE_07837 [Penicillium oxalicum 114-2]|uniref:Uncharacterized protein n=1 Tax=Penicillium oxalicum (strain 114-2 / CGMCC 5302) TaxID=933388 RepID=S7ZVV2_PENO1|nr:hypothetical protein PDE_07837 [Penicillium oxalicum 114-2]